MNEKTNYQREFTPKQGKYRKEEKFHYDNLVVGFPEKADMKTTYQEAHKPYTQNGR